MPTLRNSPHRYGWVAVVLHWGVGGLIVAALGLGLYMEELPFSPEKLRLFGIHKSLGLLILALVCVRLLWRITQTQPGVVGSLPLWQKLAARWTHRLLYILMVGMPLSGWVMSSAAGFPVSFFGLFVVPDLVAPSAPIQETAHAVHETLGLLLMALIGVHVLAALKHHVVDKDETLRRMLPVLVLLLMPVGSGLAHEDDTWRIAVEESRLEFEAVQNGAPVRGRLDAFEGAIHFDPESLEKSSIVITVFMDSVSTSYGPARDEIKKPAWLSVVKFPEARFESTDVTAKDGGYMAQGTLTLRGVSQPATLTFKFASYAPRRAEAEGELTLERTAFGVGQGAWAQTDNVEDRVTVMFFVTAYKL